MKGSEQEIIEVVEGVEEEGWEEELEWRGGV